VPAEELDCVAALCLQNVGHHCVDDHHVVWAGATGFGGGLHTPKHIVVRQCEKMYKRDLAKMQAFKGYVNRMISPAAMRDYWGKAREILS
jgi:hypothetical protein